MQTILHMNNRRGKEMWDGDKIVYPDANILHVGVAQGTLQPGFGKQKLPLRD